MLQKKPYLGIYGDQINFRHKHKTIYERQIKKINVGILGNCLILKLKNKQKVRIYLNCIRGDNGAQAVLTSAKEENGENLTRYII